MNLWEQKEEATWFLSLNLGWPETEKESLFLPLRENGSRGETDSTCCSVPFLAAVLLYPRHYLSFPAWNDRSIQENLHADTSFTDTA